MDDATKRVEAGVTSLYYISHLLSATVFAFFAETYAVRQALIAVFLASFTTGLASFSASFSLSFCAFTVVGFAGFSTVL